MNRLGWTLVVLVTGCGPVVSSPAGDSSDTGSSDTEPTPNPTVDPSTTLGSTTVPSTTSPSTTNSTTASDVTSEVTTDSSADSITFVDDTSDTDPPFECDIWAQDCARGEKCMPWANDGGSSWNATRCTPLDPDPRGTGESCMVEGSGVSGIDNCDIAAMCFNVDPETNIGECVAFCQGNEANPTCADACSHCALTGEGVLILCLPICDPILQDCGEGEGCYPTGAEAFACVPDASDQAEGGGAIGTSCEFLNACDPGSFCADGSLIPGCEGTGCCTPFCDLAAADGCDAMLPGTVCSVWTKDPQEPFESCTTGELGVCVAP